ncbi:MAG: aminoglycoside phosphotransferase family protein [Cyanobacteria bacterium P01_F01_bin.143]
MEQQTKPSLIGTPESELEINPALVYSLLQEEHPDLMHLPISQIDHGWDNAIFRLGDKLSVRLPRRQQAAKLIENEQTWLPKLALQLPIAVPIPYRIGYPTKNYPWNWSILPWLDGVTADQEEPAANQAQLWANFLRSLHVTAPPNAPTNPFRGVALVQRSRTIEQRILRLEQKTNLITQKLKNIWHDAVNTPIDVTEKWLHGDLHPRNILVKHGAISGIIDWGDITSGDIATDLASIWMLFSEQKVRQQVIEEYGNLSDTTLQRARGWAILFGVILLDTGLIDNPRQAMIGEQILSRVSKDQ